MDKENNIKKQKNEEDNRQNVTIVDMMECRERRVQIQNKLIQEFHVPVISFCMNIPGPVKTSERIRSGFESGKEDLMKALLNNRVKIYKTIEFHEITGDELLLSADAPAEKLKDIAVLIEENHKYGRLFDIDIIKINGEKISRQAYRKCLICGDQAQNCARSRKHTIEELQKQIKKILA